MSATQSVHIEAPVEKVFDWFRDPRNWPTLNPASQDAVTQAYAAPERLKELMESTQAAAGSVRKGPAPVHVSRRQGEP